MPGNAVDSQIQSRAVLAIAEGSLGRRILVRASHGSSPALCAVRENTKKQGAQPGRRLILERPRSACELSRTITSTLRNQRLQDVRPGRKRRLRLSADRTQLLTTKRQYLDPRGCQRDAELRIRFTRFSKISETLRKTAFSGVTT